MCSHRVANFGWKQKQTIVRRGPKQTELVHVAPICETAVRDPANADASIFEQLSIDRRTENEQFNSKHDRCVHRICDSRLKKNKPGLFDSKSKPIWKGWQRITG